MVARLFAVIPGSLIAGKSLNDPRTQEIQSVKPGTREGPAREHLLLTVLGRDPSAARYTLGDRESKVRLAPIALYDLLPEEDRPDRILALCTPEARRDSWPLLEDALGTRCPIEAVEIPSGDTQSDIDTFLETVIGAVAGRVDLTVDVTHGFRHFSFLTYISVLYLAALRGVRIRGAYYGMLNRNAPSPFLDLRPLLELPRWVHALEVLRETGSTLPMARILEDGPSSQPARDNARDLLHLSEAYLSGLPLEFGWQARNVREHRRRPLRKLLRDDHHLPLADKVVEQIAQILEPFALDGLPTGAGWKKQIRISGRELERQARMIDGLLARDSYATALRLMREWVVSWVIHRRTPGDGWLDRDARSAAEGLLHAIKAIGSDRDLGDALTEDQRALGRLWADLAEVRNAYAHQGMRGDDLVRDEKLKSTRGRVLGFWKDSLRSCPAISLSLGESPGGRVLVSPIGLRPGVLFSALHACRADGDGGEPALCLVVCSRETRGMIAEVLERAEFAGKVEPLLLEDAFGGGAAKIKRLAKEARRYFIGATEVLVNVTGGTTLMGLAVEELAATAWSLACPVRRFGLIDRRPPERQDAEPYRTGEPFWLDSGGEDDADRD